MVQRIVWPERDGRHRAGILGLIFLRFAEVRYAAQRAKLEKAGGSSRRGSRVDEPAAYHAVNVLYLAPEARYDFLLTLPEAANIGSKVTGAFDFVLANPPFNVNAVDKERLKDMVGAGRRYPERNAGVYSDIGI